MIAPRSLPWLVLLAVGCGAAPRASTADTAAPRALCAPEQHWDGSACRPRGDGRALIDAGAAALAEFRVDEAITALERARASGPYAYEDHVRLYEQLGVAYAYVDREADALSAFERLLALAPGHLLSYTLSPKATFLFARAREQAGARPDVALDVSWPRDLTTDQRVPIDVEVVADPPRLLARATLHMRTRGAATYRAVDLALPTTGGYRRVVLPAVALARPATVELYVTAFDAGGNEVLRWADAAHPREIALRYEPPTPWYRKWWVWAAAGTVVAAGTAGVVYAITREPPDTVGGEIEIP